MNASITARPLLPIFRSHKLVAAFLIAGIDPDTNIVHGRDGVALQVAPGWIERNPRATTEHGYLVQYADGYTSWSPREAFEAGNTLSANWGIRRSQEPKYFTNEQGRLTNRATGKPIPDEEPVFVLRAQDKHAIEVLQVYERNVVKEEHAAVVQQRIADFKAYAISYPERMKEPDSKAPLPPVPTV